VFIDRAEAVNTSGETILALTDLVGLVIARVPSQAEPLAPAGAARPAAPGTLAGKIALVTGSSRGIGKAVARRLAEEGAQVIVNSFHSRDRGEQTAAEIIARGGKALHVWGSVANPAHLERMFAEVGAKCGGLDYFISNAGAGVFAPLADVTAEHWDRAFRTNVVALHRGAYLAAQLMRRRGGGRIVAVSSVGAHLCFEHFGCIGPVKAAEESLARYLATELAADNIQVNAVSAGPVLGELLDGFPSRPRWEHVAPRRRLNSAEEVVEAVLFLLTAAGTNGTVLPVDAGVGLRVCEPLP
jgi:NAD(P)-dependent dehydrogenase (short-subunit alcohol dehydrogenase family)